jgi:hypothetical protein
MDQELIIDYIRERFTGVDIVRPQRGDEAPAIAWGDTFFIYDPARNLEAQRRMPFATIVTKDYGEFDRACDLDRDGVFRLNIGVGKEVYRSLFGGAAAEHDFTALDQLMPHPVYASQSWICILNPSHVTFATLQPLLADAYSQAVRRYQRHQTKQ